MKFSWNAPLSKAVHLLTDYGTHDLFFYGVSIGWLGLGFVVGRVRQPTRRAADGEEPVRLNFTITDDDVKRTEELFPHLRRR